MHYEERTAMVLWASVTWRKSISRCGLLGTHTLALPNTLGAFVSWRGPGLLGYSESEMKQFRD